MTVIVAPREIVDAVDRACRVAGLDAGIAARVASDTAYCEVHHRDGVDRFLRLLGEPDVLRRHVVDAMSSATATVPFLLRCRRPDASAFDRERQALAHGVQVDGALWAQLHARAAAFRLSEALIDGRPPS